jgi:hypothetical protein
LGSLNRRSLTSAFDRPIAETIIQPLRIKKKAVNDPSFEGADGFKAHVEHSGATTA